MLLVVGDAGVGKTRFVAEGLRRAAGSGVVVARGGCLPLAEQLPLLPMAGALGELAAVDGGALVEGALGVAPGVWPGGGGGGVAAGAAVFCGGGVAGCGGGPARGGCGGRGCALGGCL